MQYAKMIDLLQASKNAGLNCTEGITNMLCESFATWLDMQDVSEITEEENEDLEKAFFRGFAKNLE